MQVEIEKSELLSSKLEIFIKNLTDEDKDNMLRYDIPCLQDAVSIIARIERIQVMIQARNQLTDTEKIQQMVEA